MRNSEGHCILNFSDSSATWWCIFLIGHAVLQSEVEQNFRFGWLNQKLFREMKFYVFPRKWNDIYFFNFHEGQQQKKQSNTKLNRETKKHKEQVKNEQMYVSFIQRTLKLLKDNFSSLNTTTKKNSYFKMSRWLYDGRGNREYRVRIAL